MKIMEVLPSHAANKDAASAMILAECRMIFKNQGLLDKVSGIKEKFIKVHTEFKNQSADHQLKQTIDDVLSLVGN